MKNLDDDITIGQLANLANIGVETLRFYQRRGLLEVPETEGKVRFYTHDHLRRLTFIKNAKLAGFTLSEIYQLLDFDARAGRRQARMLAKQRLVQIDYQMQTLITARNALTKLVTACDSGKQGPCPILEAFESDNSIMDT